MQIISFLKITHSKSSSTPSPPPPSGSTKPPSAGKRYEPEEPRDDGRGWLQLWCLCWGQRQEALWEGKGGVEDQLREHQALEKRLQESQRLSPTTCGNVGPSLKRLKMLPRLLSISVRAQIERSLSPLVEETKGPRKVAGCKHFPCLRQRLSSVSSENTGIIGLRTMIS